MNPYNRASVRRPFRRLPPSILAACVFLLLPFYLLFGVAQGTWEALADWWKTIHEMWRIDD